MDSVRMALYFFMCACFLIQLCLLCVLWNIWDTVPKVLDFWILRSGITICMLNYIFSFWIFFFVPLMFFSTWNVLILRCRALFFLFWRGFINTHSDCALEIAWNLHINSLPYFSFMATNGNTSWKVSHCCLL